ncbi:hypothetical protein M408DRAFT_232281 [Serendipita vermifera MAFF 305830]|uniref:TNase-like domain-containing protein n=1 Tax=Serendipita vermifera MAFF 305830 TaxID=933852 RepID=A0A0C3AZ18_SERVB|nr:hypothetical protein M408DRAFT_232281 [Serendipita vermifera MAFF 305830]
MPPISNSPPERSWLDTAKSTYTVVYNAVEPAVSYPLSVLPYEVKLGVLVLGTVGATLATGKMYKRFIKRIPNADAVSPEEVAKRRWIKGVVTSVGDADNFRLYHTPGIGWRWPLKFRFIPKTTKELKDQTIHIRMAGADAPEAAHFGKEAQPYAAEALAWLRGYVLEKRIWCQMVHKDQYGRIVAVPMLPTIIPFRYRNVSLEMIRAGWATVYEQSNAVYGKEGKARYLAIEATAKSARRGMWEKGVDGETPAAYKKRHAAATASKG